MKKEIKTNAMRFLDNLNIEYEHIDYGLDHEFVSSVDLAEEGHTDIHTIFKTLATESKERDVYILVINGADEIDFKAAKAVVLRAFPCLPLKILRKLLVMKEEPQLRLH